MLLIIAFLMGYTLIALEHPLKIDKASSALLTGVALWTLLVIGHTLELNPAGIENELMEHLSEIASILFFFLGAMTIVELVDSHDGFKVITTRIKTTNKVTLLWLLSVISFFLSAILDNLTTSIVMATLLRKLIRKKEDLWYFAGFVVIAANAGGAWSPIGDVTTIMLWIGGQITAVKIIYTIILPSIVCMVIPLGIVSFSLKGKVGVVKEKVRSKSTEVSNFERRLVFFMGVGALLFVPVFKNFTHLPPFMGIMLGLSILWITTELLHRKKDADQRSFLTVTATIRRVDTPSVLFFLGVLLAVGALETGGQLGDLANWLDKTFPNIYTVNTLIGLLSAVVDNVPLVAGAMGMYSLDYYAQDHEFWTLLAYCAGTGGSALIIGSAAGVAIMGLLRIDFIWYLKKISWLAILGYLAGIGAYLLLR